METRYEMEHQISLINSTLESLYERLNNYIKVRNKINWTILYYEDRLKHHNYHSHRPTPAEMSEKLLRLYDRRDEVQAKICLCRRDIEHLQYELNTLRSIDRSMWDYKESVDNIAKYLF